MVLKSPTLTVCVGLSDNGAVSSPALARKTPEKINVAMIARQARVHREVAFKRDSPFGTYLKRLQDKTTSYRRSGPSVRQEPLDGICYFLLFFQCLSEKSMKRFQSYSTRLCVPARMWYPMCPAFKG